MQPTYGILSFLLTTFKKVKLMSVMYFIIIQYHILYSTKSITQNIIM